MRFRASNKASSILGSTAIPFRLHFPASNSSLNISTMEGAEAPSATRNGGCGRPSAILPQPFSVPATAASALSMVRMSPFVPDFWAKFITTAARTMNARRHGRTAAAPRSSHLPQVVAASSAVSVPAPTRQMSANRSLMQSTAVVYQNSPLPALRRRLLLYRQAKARLDGIDGDILVRNAEATPRHLYKIP